MSTNLDRYARDLDRLLRVSRAMTGERDLLRLLDLILEAAKELLTADRCSLFVVDQATGELWTSIAQHSGTIRLPRGKGIAGTVAETAAVINIPEAYADERFDRGNDERSGYRTRSILALPLVSHESRVVGVLQALNKDGGPFDEYDQQIALALCSQAAVAVDTAQLIERDMERQRLARDMELANKIQQSLLPRTPASLPGWRFAHWQQPCDATGGDYHDYLIGDDMVDLVVGDVSGHGLGAAMMMSTARASLRALYQGGLAPGLLLERLNALLEADMAEDCFMTMALCRLGSDGAVRYASAGHEPPMIYREAGRRFDELDSTGLMLGVVNDADYDELALTR
ncbi:MAG: SpoIIE family protein phosphatase, partial [Planctomycetota bacterium]|nr:SpoIIE family protein phosphatase [Planctomycetota bacterium]